MIFLSKFEAIGENLTVPYDCQFFIAQSDNGKNFAIKETYNINNKPFLTEFGTWDPYYGLVIPQSNFYLRRQDMNGSVITTEQNLENVRGKLKSIISKYSIIKI